MVTLHVKRVTSTEDAHHNEQITYGSPQEWDVWWLAPGAIQEQATGDRDLSVVVWTVGAPNNTQAPTEYDLVTVDGEDFAVNGRPHDWTRGPFQNPSAGIAVELRRAEG